MAPVNGSLRSDPTTPAHSGRGIPYNQCRVLRTNLQAGKAEVIASSRHTPPNSGTVYSRGHTGCIAYCEQMLYNAFG